WVCNDCDGYPADRCISEGVSASDECEFRLHRAGHRDFPNHLGFLAHHRRHPVGVRERPDVRQQPRILSVIRIDGAAPAELCNRQRIHLPRSPEQIEPILTAIRAAPDLPPRITLLTALVPPFILHDYSQTPMSGTWLDHSGSAVRFCVRPESFLFPGRWCGV